MRRAPFALFGVGSVLFLLVMGDALSVILWARNIGLAEDWVMVPAMTGNEPHLLEWLWSQNNEHRLPVQRLIYLGLLRATGDFRSGMFFSQLLLVLLSGALVWAVATTRGRHVRWSDAVFPLALLHLGHWENLVWGWQLQFVWSTAIAGFLLAIVIARPRIALSSAIPAALCLLLLPISGANGIVLTVAMSIWLAGQGVALLRAGQDTVDERTGYLSLAAAATSVLLIGVYLIGYESPPWSPPRPTLFEFLRATAHYFAYALGPAARAFTIPAAIAVLLIIGTGALLAGHAAFRGGKERLRALGLAMFVSAGIALALAVAWGRGSYPYRMPDRYALLSVLTLLAALCAWDLYGPRRLARAIRASLVTTFFLLVPLNIRAGFEWRDWYVAGMQKVEADLTAGVASPEIARRHAPFLMHWSEDKLREAMEMLREAHIGPFAPR